MEIPVLEFVLNGERRLLDDFDPTMDLATYLRNVELLRGTKVGSGEGNTGASTVMISRSRGGNTVHEAINSAVFPLPMVHHCAITTIEGVGSAKLDTLNKVQETMANASAMQCGYCTPGIVMSLVSMMQNTDSPDLEDFETCMTGHLCRCTGYASYYRAFQKLLPCEETAATIKSLAPAIPEDWQTPETITTAPFTTTTAEEALEIIGLGGELCGGSVDFHYQHAVKHSILPPRVRITGSTISVEENKVIIGTEATLSDLQLLFATAADKHPPTNRLAKYVGRIANPQIRNQATVIGSLCLGDRRSDIIPLLMALDANATFLTESGVKQMPISEFILDHKLLNMPEVAVVTEIDFELPTGAISAQMVKPRRVNSPSTLAVVIVEGKATAISGGIVHKPIVVTNLSPDLFRKEPELGVGFVERVIGLLHSEDEEISPQWPETDFTHEAAPENWIHQPLPREDAKFMVSGEAQFTVDHVEPADCLFGAYVHSRHPHAKIVSIDTSLLEDAEGYFGLVTADDCSRLVLSGIEFDTRIFAKGEVEFVGEPVGLVIASSDRLAREYAQLVEVEYEPLPAVLSLEQAQEEDSTFDEIRSRVVHRGDVTEVDHAPVVVRGEMHMGGQDHMYMEVNNTLAIPTEPYFTVYCSTQNVGKVQADVAAALGLPMSRVLVKVHRLGGGFGGKQDRPAFVACAAAVAAKKVNRPVRLTLSRSEDMLISGGRHMWHAYYKAASDEEGNFIGADIKILMDCGSVFDVSGPVMEKMVCQSESVYYWPHWRCEGRACKLNKTTPTAFRGFGVPQALALTESIVEHIATAGDFDIVDLRRRNFLKDGQTTAVTCFIENNQYKEPLFPIPAMYESVIETSDYAQRAAAVEEFNATHTDKKRGIAITPSKCATCFEVDFMNTGGALVEIFHDGTVSLSHSAVEMGQGVHTKMRQLCAETLGIDISLVNVVETSTDRVPNTQPTAASSGADVAGPSVIKACETLNERIAPIREKHPDKDWHSLMWECYMNRIDLCAQSKHALPELGFNWDDLTGYVGYYYVYGAAISEVEIDILTGEWKVLRADVIQDAGRSLNPLMDVHQAEGAFIQGMGLYTMEDVQLDDQLVFKNANLQSYHIPTHDDMPRKLHVHLLPQHPNPQNVAGSKACAEGPLSNGISVFFAIRHAIAAARKDTGKGEFFRFDSPATTEKIRQAIRR